MEILENQILEMRNVLSFRGKMTQDEVSDKIQKTILLINNCGARLSSPMTTTTYSVEQKGRRVYMDVELLFPIDKKIEYPSAYIWKDHFCLTNALKIRHEGNPSGLQATVNELNAYIAQNKLQPITTGYNVTVKSAETVDDLSGVIIDIYVGINPNVL